MLIDCGRIMATEVHDMSLLDYACNASLILAHSAVKNHYSVSLLCFRSTITNYIPPTKDKKDTHKLDLVLSHAEFEHVEPNYSGAKRPSTTCGVWESTFSTSIRGGFGAAGEPLSGKEQELAGTQTDGLGGRRRCTVFAHDRHLCWYRN